MNELGDGNDYNNWQGVSNPYPPRNAKKTVWQSGTDDTLVQSANFMFSGESTSPSSLHANGKIKTENKIKFKKIKN